MPTRTAEPSISSSIVSHFADYVRSLGCDTARLPRLAALNVALASAEQNDVPLDTFAVLLEEASHAVGDPCIGLGFAEALPPGASGVYGYLLTNARTLEEAFRVTERYVSLVMHPIDVAFEIEGETASLTWAFPPFAHTMATQYLLFATAVIVLRMRAIAGPRWNPLAVELAHRGVPCPEAVRRVMGPLVRFNATHNRIVVDAATLNRRSPNADDRLFAIIQDLGERLLKERQGEGGISHETRQAITASLNVGGEVSLEAIALSLGLSARTLQQRLGAAGTTFEALLQDTRRSLAASYLRDTDLSLTEIALLLGFSELSAFTRASMRWFGHPPSAMRQRLRGMEAVARIPTAATQRS